MRFLPSLAAATSCLALLASCVGAPQQRPVAQAPAPVAPRPAAPTPTPTPSAPVPAAWEDRALTPGDWSYRAEAAGPVASFGSAGAAPRLTVRCDRAGGRIVFTRPGAGSGSMTVRTTYGAQVWPASAATNGVSATRAASDGGLDQIAYSRGKIAVETPGLDPLILPAWAEVARVVEDCRG
jgi:hypothetical protein